MNHYTPLPMPRITGLLLFVVAFTLFIHDFYFFSLFLPILFFFFLTRQLQFSTIGSSVWIVLALLSLAFVVASVNATDMAVARETFKFILYSFLLMFFVSSMVDKYGYAPIDIIFKGTTALSLIACIFSLGVYYGILPPPGWRMLDPSRLQGFSGNPNAFGIELALAAMYLYYRLGITTKPLKKTMIGAALAIVVLCILMTYSRAAWAALIVAVCGYSFFIALQKKSARAMGRLLLNVCGFVVIALCIWMVAESLDSTHLIRQRFQLQDYDNERFMVDHIALEASIKNPLGIGPGQSVVFLSNYYSNLETTGAVHNAYLRILFEAGFAGEFFYLFFLIYVAILGLRISIAPWELSRISALVTCLFFGCLLEGAVVETLFSRDFWIVNGMICGLNILHVRRTRAGLL